MAFDSITQYLHTYTGNGVYEYSDSYISYGGGGANVHKKWCKNIWEL